MCLTELSINVMFSVMLCYVMVEYLHFSKTSLDEPLDVHLFSYFHELHRVTRRHMTSNLTSKYNAFANLIGRCKRQRRSAV